VPRHERRRTRANPPTCSSSTRSLTATSPTSSTTTQSASRGFERAPGKCHITKDDERGLTHHPAARRPLRRVLRGPPARTRRDQQARGFERAPGKCCITNDDERRLTQHPVARRPLRRVPLRPARMRPDRPTPGCLPPSSENKSAP